MKRLYNFSIRNQQVILDNYKRVLDLEHFAVTQKNSDMWCGVPLNYKDDISE